MHFRGSPCPNESREFGCFGDVILLLRLIICDSTFTTLQPATDYLPECLVPCTTYHKSHTSRRYGVAKHTHLVFRNSPTIEHSSFCILPESKNIDIYKRSGLPDRTARISEPRLFLLFVSERRAKACHTVEDDHSRDFCMLAM